MSHSGDIIGNILCVYGGYNTEYKHYLNELNLYDFDENTWLNSKINYI